MKKVLRKSEKPWKTVKFMERRRRSTESIKAFHDRLEQCARLCGNSAKLASLSGISCSGISARKRTELRDMSPYAVERIAEAAGVNPGWLMFGEGACERDGEPSYYRVSKATHHALPYLLPSQAPALEEKWAYIEKAALMNSVVGLTDKKLAQLAAFRFLQQNRTAKYLLGEWLIVERGPLNDTGNYCIDFGSRIEVREVVFVEPNLVQMMQPHGDLIRNSVKAVTLESFSERFKVVARVVVVCRWDTFSSVLAPITPSPE